jgi:small-conductance mechanosensitive channel
MPEESSAQSTEQQVLSTPTLAPTATPSQLDYVVDDITQRVGIDHLILFGLEGDSLINLLISLFIVLLGSLLGVLVVNAVLWLTKRTPPTFDDRLVESIDGQLKWLITLSLLQFATARLDFLDPVAKQWLNLIYFSLFVLVIASLVMKLIDYGLEGPLIRASSPQNRNLLITFAPLLRRLVQVAIFVVALAIILQNLGVNLSALLAVLGLGGLAVSLAAKETLEDMISGFIILIDRPFQIGDRIKLESMDSWGDVVAIGSRTTRIRTLDNRLVIVPNSVIGRSQIENFTYPDTNYRIDISVGIGYGSDIDQVIETIEKAVLSVPDVLEVPEPFIGFEEFGDSAMVFVIRYWLGSYSDIQVKTKVNKAIYQSLTEANIEMPFTTYDVNLAYKESIPDSESE